MNYEELLGAIARGWCTPVNEKKVMDSDLAVAIAEEVVKYLAQPEQSEPVGEAEPYSGRSADHTQAIFHRDVVPVGTKLYTAPYLRELTDMEIRAIYMQYGTGRLDGFTAAVSAVLAAARKAP